MRQGADIAARRGMRGGIERSGGGEQGEGSDKLDHRRLPILPPDEPQLNAVPAQRTLPRSPARAKGAPFR
ncbi:hypothetical protein GCM10011617_30270 [Novosphingobium arvoryzae]|uniref:Uncharacterized protein n=1 Tax=Novosphingobium arvoryzae TaxID=1256514 RepID=A0A918RR99_9SPHN|nr:hypothetical protein GCM10011617_30270 [Novosphingobium arvoryzae]